jgi:hypothetical protein
MPRRGTGRYPSANEYTRSPPRKKNSSSHASQAAPPGTKRSTTTPKLGEGGSGLGSSLAQATAIGAGAAIGHAAVGRMMYDQSENSAGDDYAAIVPEEDELIDLGHPCQEEYALFHRCVNANQKDISQCQTHYDIFQFCQQNPE